MRLVLVQWEDSVSASGWTKLDRYGFCPIITVGWLVNQDKYVVTISSSWDYESNVIDPISIPRGCIRSISDIAEVDFPRQS